MGKTTLQILFLVLVMTKFSRPALLIMALRRRAWVALLNSEDTIFNQLHNYRDLEIVYPNVSSQIAAVET